MIIDFDLFINPSHAMALRIVDMTVNDWHEKTKIRINLKFSALSDNDELIFACTLSVENWFKKSLKVIKKLEKCMLHNALRVLF